MPKRKARDSSDDDDDDAFSDDSFGADGKQKKKRSEAKTPAAKSAASNPSAASVKKAAKAAADKDVGGSDKKKRAPAKAKDADPEKFPKSSPPGTMERNAEIASILDLLVDVERASPDVNHWAVKGMEKAASNIRNCWFPIQSGKQAMACLAGVGKGTGDKIDEFIATGKLSMLQGVKLDNRAESRKQLERVHGIGPAKSADLYEQGIDSLDALAGRLDLLNDAQRVGLRYLKQLEQRIPRSEVVQLEQRVKDAARRVDPSLNVEVCGSYRRGLKDSGDIDVLMTHPGFIAEDPSKPDSAPKQHAAMLAKLVAELQRDGVITDTLAAGKTKYMGICRVPTTEEAAAAKASGQQQIPPQEDDAPSPSAASASAKAAASYGGGGIADEDDDVLLISDSDDEPRVASSSSSAAAAATSSSASAAAASAPQPDAMDTAINFGDLDALDDALAAQESRAAERARHTDAAEARALAEKVRKDREAKASAAAASAAAAQASSSSSSSSSAAAAAPPVSAIDSAPLPAGNLHRRIDIRFLPYNCWAPALLYFTGSGPFNEGMRMFARLKGFTLNEYALRRLAPGDAPGEFVHVNSERDIFAVLGVPYVPPMQRESWGNPGGGSGGGIYFDGAGGGGGSGSAYVYIG